MRDASARHVVRRRCETPTGETQRSYIMGLDAESHSEWRDAHVRDAAWRHADGRDDDKQS